jgi:hypothetical protein
VLLFGLFIENLLIINVSTAEVHPTAHQTMHFGLCTILISTTLALISKCKCIA